MRAISTHWLKWTFASRKRWMPVVATQVIILFGWMRMLNEGPGNWTWPIATFWLCISILLWYGRWLLWRRNRTLEQESRVPRGKSGDQ